MNHILSIDESKNLITVNNLESQIAKVEFINLGTNFCAYQKEISKKMFSSCFIEPPNNYRVYIREKSDFEIDLHIYDVIYSGGKYEIKKIDPLDSFDFDQEIFLITGNAGGGTSIVTKFLRYLGAHSGDDSSKFEIRKPHEPTGFKMWVYSLDPSFPVPYHKKNLLKIFKTYGYKKGEVNIAKIPESGDFITLIGEVFPNLKILSIVRSQNNFSFTQEGERFNSMEKWEVQKNQFPMIEGFPIFHVDFNRFFIDYKYVNRILKFLKIDCYISNEDQFNLIKHHIKFNEKVLD